MILLQFPKHEFKHSSCDDTQFLCKPNLLRTISDEQSKTQLEFSSLPALSVASALSSIEYNSTLLYIIYHGN